MLFSLENLYRHYLQCRRNKRNTLNALRFEARQEDLQLDIHNYFMSIDKNILLPRLAPKIHDDNVLWLTRLLVFQDCTQDYLLKGDPELLARIPPHKTLFGAGPNRGLPIGNLNSQFSANVYLNGLDQFVKHQLHCRHYLRYCDDFVLLAPEREQLLDWREQIAAYLRENLRLELNPKRQRLRPVSDGVDFLGYIVRGDYRLVRRRVVNHLHERLCDYQTRLVVERPIYRRYRFDQVLLDQLHSTLASYLGHFQKADTYRLCQAIWADYPFLAQYFDFDPERSLLSRKYRPPGGFQRVADQYPLLPLAFSRRRTVFPGRALLRVLPSPGRRRGPPAETEAAETQSPPRLMGFPGGTNPAKIPVLAGTGPVRGLDRPHRPLPHRHRRTAASMSDGVSNAFPVKSPWFVARMEQIL